LVARYLLVPGFLFDFKPPYVKPPCVKSCWIKSCWIKSSWIIYIPIKLIFNTIKRVAINICIPYFSKRGVECWFIFTLPEVAGSPTEAFRDDGKLSGRFLCLLVFMFTGFFIYGDVHRCTNSAGAWMRRSCYSRCLFILHMCLH